MAYQLYVSRQGITIAWVGDGVNQLSVPGAQALTVNVGTWPAPGTLITTVGGGDSPTATNIISAANTLATAIGAALTTTANLATIQGWASGKP